jgi:N-acetylglucosaminyldiphosphoundecaprenol N-acetyl-beta-D-mannosaminyltransferase
MSELNGRTTSVKHGEVCGVPLACVTLDEAASLIVHSGLARLPFETHLCNAYTLSLVDDDRGLRDALLGADLNLPDGTPVAWALRRYHGGQGAVRGPALVPAVARLGAAHGLRHYLWGARAGVAEAASARLRLMVPGVHIVGVESPRYGQSSDAELADLADRVNDANAHVLWVGVGTPLQDIIASRVARQIACPVVPVGAAFDYLAGTVPEAPEFLKGSGFEWLYRLAREPKRLWRRYLIGNPRFLLSAIRHEISRE